MAEKLIQTIVAADVPSEVIDCAGWQSLELSRGLVDGIVFVILRSGAEHAEQFRSGRRLAPGEVLPSGDPVDPSGKGAQADAARARRFGR